MPVLVALAVIALILVSGWIPGFSWGWALTMILISVVGTFLTTSMDDEEQRIDLKLKLSNGMTVKVNFDTGLLVFTTPTKRKVYLGTDIQEAFLEFVEVTKLVDEMNSVYSSSYKDYVFFFGTNISKEALGIEGEYEEFYSSAKLEDVGVLLENFGKLPEHLVVDEDSEEVTCVVYKMHKTDAPELQIFRF